MLYDYMEGRHKDCGKLRLMPIPLHTGLSLQVLPETPPQGLHTTCPGGASWRTSFKI